MKATWWLLVAALAACTGGTPPTDEGGDTDDTDVDTEVDTDADTDPGPDTDGGPDTDDGVDTDVVSPVPLETVRVDVLFQHTAISLTEGERLRWRAVAGDGLDGVWSPALCLLRDELCVASLPDVVDTPVDLTTFSRGDLSPTSLEIGDPVRVGAGRLARTAAGGGALFWQEDVSVAPRPGLKQVLLGGVFADGGPFAVDAFEMPAGLIEATSPRADQLVLMLPGRTMDIRWTVPPDPPPAPPVDTGDTFSAYVPPPPKGRVLLHLQFPGIDRMVPLADDGAHVLSLDALDASIPPGFVQGTVSLLRVHESEASARGARVTGRFISRQSWRVLRPGTSCRQIRDTDPTAPSGIYPIALPGQSTLTDVYCDMTTDGGGWMLVVSSDIPVQDRALGYDTNLTTLFPLDAHDGVWSGPRAFVTGNTDVRMSCKVNVMQTRMDVDLSFYDVGWYRTATTSSSDSGSCLHTAPSVEPARRNNLTGSFLPLGSPYTAGFLQMESSCTDSCDFLVDFNDGAFQGTLDPTDWGEDDCDDICGVNLGGGANGAAWFMWIREPAPPPPAMP